jgi:hypothetical protein
MLCDCKTCKSVKRAFDVTWWASIVGVPVTFIISYFVK